MAKKTEVQRVIDGLETDKAAIQKTIDLLRAQQSSKPVRVRKAKAAVEHVAEARR